MGLSDMGFSKPTPIQIQAIPAVLEGKDLLASAQTGTGKTAAFALPLLEKLSTNKKVGIRALILAPTRELAMQIDEQFWSIGYHTGITTASVYGGTDWGAQEQAIRDGVNVLVATPGRLLDHIKVSNVDFSKIEFLVLDEADRMLDMGFIPDVMTIIRRLPKERQTLLFSATLSDKIEHLARELTKNPLRINISSFIPAEGVEQIAYKVNDDGKLNLVLHLFDDSEVASAIVFTSTKRGADSLARALRKKGVKVSSIHGDRDQKEREATLGDFKAGRINVIVATDVMARGIDVTGVSHVLNFDVPRDLDDYIHRIGRTARAEKKGTAITLVSRNDSRYFQVIKDKMKDRLTIIENPVVGADQQDQPSESTQSEARQGDNSRRRSNQNRPRPAKRTAPASSDKPVSEIAVSAPDQTKSVSLNQKASSASTEQQTDIEKPKSNNKRRNNRRKKPAGQTTSDQPKLEKTKVMDSPKPESNSRNGRNKRVARGKQSDDSRNNPDREKLRQERIQQVSNPFQSGKIDAKPQDKKGDGLWGTIKKVFGLKK